MRVSVGVRSKIRDVMPTAVVKNVTTEHFDDCFPQASIAATAAERRGLEYFRALCARKQRICLARRHLIFHALLEIVLQYESCSGCRLYLAGIHRNTHAIQQEAYARSQNCHRRCGGGHYRLVSARFCRHRISKCGNAKIGRWVAMKDDHPFK